MSRQPTILRPAILALGAVMLLGGCETVDLDRVREANPFRTAAPDADAPAPDTANAPSTDSTQTAGATATTGAPVAYDMPTGGPDTFSLSVASCLDVSQCPPVNVMIDPDNYWQRTDSDTITSGQGRSGLYNEVTAVFQNQGFYRFNGQLDIVPSNPSTCPNYEEGGQGFFISMSRNASTRLVTFDTGCAGAASADAAADAINGIVAIRDYMDVVSGTYGEADETPATN